MYTSAEILPTVRERWVAGLICALLVVAVIATLPAGGTPLPVVAAFLPVYVTLAATGDAFTAFLLLVQFRAGGAPALAPLAVAYTFTALVAVAQAISFPGLFGPVGLFGADSQTAVWLWVAWHAGFPLLVAGYAIARRTRARVAPATFGGVAGVIGVAVVLALGVVAIAYRSPLPALVAGNNYDGGFYGTWQTVIAAATLALVANIVLTRLSTVLDLWLTVVLVSTLCDIVLTLAAHQRFSVGWYLARVYSVVTSLTVALVFVAEFARLYGRYARLASVDPLTGCANRRTFDERLDEALRAAARMRTPLALIMIDVDDFKRYNDTYGHIMGDEALRAVADAIRRVVSRPRDIVARYGGEEFTVVLADTDPEGAYHVAEQIRREVENRRIPHVANRAAPYVTISLGVAGADLADRGPKPMIERADRALYQAKEGGRNHVVLDLVTPASVPEGTANAPV